MKPDPKPIRCDGETFFGFTVKACDKPATVRRKNGTYEVYWFCPRHDFFYFNGRYAEDAEKVKRDVSNSESEVA